MEKSTKMLPKSKTTTVTVIQKRNNKKKTHEEYVAEVDIKNPNVEVVGKYINAKTKIKHRCIVHNIYWDVKPESVLLGSGCKKCKKEKLKIIKTKTNEQYIHEVKSINPDIIVLEQYIGANIPISHKCLKHGVEWKPFPDAILRGYGCPECCKEKIGNSLRRSHNEYVDAVGLINPNIEVIGEYKGSHIKLLHKCKIDGYEWETVPSSILFGYGCPICGKNISNKKRTRTCENYIKKLSTINPYIEVIGEYINSQTNILHKCKIDGHKWMLKPNNALNGYGCPVCAGNLKKTTADYIQEVLLINPNIEVIEEYVQASVPILHKCKIDNYEWMALPSNILHGSGCPKCNGGIKKKHEDYVYKLSIINPDVEVIEEYINARTSILHKCKIDGYMWEAPPCRTLNGQGCPQCNESNGERQIRQWLDRHNIEYEMQKTFDSCIDVKLLPFDFYLPTNNITIEYDGIQHFEPVEIFGGQEAFEKTVKHDNIKNEYCKNNGISLLRIPYFKNVEEELNNFLFI